VWPPSLLVASTLSSDATPSRRTILLLEKSFMPPMLLCMHARRILPLLLLASLNFAAEGQHAGTGLIHPRLAPAGRVVA